LKVIKKRKTESLGGSGTKGEPCRRWLMKESGLIGKRRQQGEQAEGKTVKKGDGGDVGSSYSNGLSV